MFEQMLLPTGGTHVGRNTVIAFAGQLAAVALLTIAMMYFNVVPFPFPQPAIPLYLAPPPPPPPPAAATRAPVQTAAKTFVPRTFILPTPTLVAIPQHAAITSEAPPSLPDLSG